MSLVPGRQCSRLGLAALLLVLAACESAPTPLPIIPITPSPVITLAAEAPTATPLRVGVDGRLLSLLSEARLRAWLNAYEPVAPANLGQLSGYDGALALSPSPSEAALNQNLQFNLTLDSTLPPLDQPSVAGYVETVFDADALRLALGLCDDGCPPLQSISRDTLANAGFPDGLTLTLTNPPDMLPLAQALASIASTADIELRLIGDTQSTHLTLTFAEASQNAWLTLPLYGGGDPAWLAGVTANVP